MRAIFRCLWEVSINPLKIILTMRTILLLDYQAQLNCISPKRITKLLYHVIKKRFYSINHFLQRPDQAWPIVSISWKNMKWHWLVSKELWIWILIVYKQLLAMQPLITFRDKKINTLTYLIKLIKLIIIIRQCFFICVNIT